VKSVSNVFQINVNLSTQEASEMEVTVVAVPLAAARILIAPVGSTEIDTGLLPQLASQADLSRVCCTPS
jgi:hypothetical protein